MEVRVNKKEFVELVRSIYDNAEKKGFHKEERSEEREILLLTEEIMEIYKAFRKGNLFEQCDKDIPNYTYFQEEPSDIIIRWLDFIAEYGERSIEMAYDLLPKKPIKPIRDIEDACYRMTQYNLIFGIREKNFVKQFEIISALFNGYDYDLWESIKTKHEFNKTRPYLHGKKF